MNTSLSPGTGQSGYQARAPPSPESSSLKRAVTTAPTGSLTPPSSAATGTPPRFPSSFCTSGRWVISMKSYASSLFFALDGTTHKLPPDPGCRSLPGNRNWSHSKSAMSLAKGPAHQVPE
ncbi:hypothetical protein D3C74_421090 [compost metagenome]